MIQEDKDDQNTVPSSTSNAGPLPQDIREEDRKFLDDLMQKDGNLLSAPVQTISPGGTDDLNPKSVPRAELVVNSEIVRRGELIVRSGKVPCWPRRAREPDRQGVQDAFANNGSR